MNWLKLNDWLGKLPTHQAVIASGLVEGFLTGLALPIAGLLNRGIDPTILTIWLGFVAGEIAGGVFSGYTKRTTDANYVLAKAGIVPPALKGVEPAPPIEPPVPA